MLLDLLRTIRMKRLPLKIQPAPAASYLCCNLNRQECKRGANAKCDLGRIYHRQQAHYPKSLLSGAVKQEGVGEVKGRTRTPLGLWDHPENSHQHSDISSRR